MGAIVRGVSTDVQTEMMAKLLAIVKRSSKAQVYREGVRKLFKEEFGTVNVERVMKELGIKL